MNPINQPSAKKIFVLLLGPSGVGKTTLIQAILRERSDIEYVKPYTTRQLRLRENDKISVSVEHFDAMQQRGDFLVVNEHFGYKYGTPRATISNTLATGKIPILDYQLANAQNLVSNDYDLFCIYVKPKSLEEWSARLKASTQYSDHRYRVGLDELRAVSSEVPPVINAVVVNESGKQLRAAEEILKQIDLKIDIS